MIDWIVNNASVVNAVSSVAMLAVWMVYLQVFLSGYRRQTRAKIVINRAVGNTLDAHCFISNMSQNSIYVEAVIVTLQCEGIEASQWVTDLDTSPDSRPADPRKETHQGPLHSGDHTSIGTFSELIQRIAACQRDTVPDLSAFTGSLTIQVMVIADYLAEDLVIGAKRRFTAERDGKTWLLRPDSIQTEQIRSRGKRRAIRRFVVNDAEQDSSDNP